MKKIIYFILITAILNACNDEFYTEGRIETVKSTEITKQSATLYGKIKIVKKSKEISKILRRGFVYGISANELTAIREDGEGLVYNELSNEGKFSENIRGLQPNTQYYAKAFFVFVQNRNKNGRVVYYSNQNKLIYLYEGVDVDDDYGYLEYCEVNVFYGNIIEFTTKDF